MQFPRLPDWAIYGAVAGVLLAVSLGRRENADSADSAESGGVINRYRRRYRGVPAG